LKEAGMAYELLGREDLPQAEPALAYSDGKLVGGLRLPGDETGDCHIFTTRLTEEAKKLGVEFHYGVNVQQLHVVGWRISGVQCDGRLMQADAYVAALGSYSPLLLKGLESVPVYPMKGYSITVPIADESRAPVSTLLDETYKIAITRFDKR